MITVYRANKIFKEEVQKAVKAGLPIPAEVFDLEPTISRAKSFLGQCCVRRGKVAMIKVSKYLLEYDTDTQLRETIAHELCHTVAFNDHHGPKFRMYASMLNRAYGYHISRTATREESEEFNRVAEYVAPTKIYAVKCLKCGQLIKRAKMSKVIVHPERFACGKCHGKLQRVA